MNDELIKAVDDALLRAWRLGIANGIDGESEYSSAWRRADEAATKFEALRAAMRTQLEAEKQKPI